jgi:hypothetical protein
MPVCCTGVGSSFGIGVGAARVGRARPRARRSGRCILAVWWSSLGEHWVLIGIGGGKESETQWAREGI